MPRKYEKRSPYWNQRKGESNASVESQEARLASFFPQSFGEAYAEQFPEDTTSRRGTNGRSSAIGKERFQFSQIKNALLPYELNSRGGFYEMREAIDVVQRAYSSVGLVRNTIDILSELTDESIFLEGGSKKSQNFFRAWFETIGLDAIKEQFFREFYRSGNVFVYSLFGDISYDTFGKYPRGSTSHKVKIPIKYTLLNPYDVVCDSSSNFSIRSYGKIFSKQDFLRLKDPQTDNDKNFKKSLPAKIQAMFNSGFYTGETNYPLEWSRLSVSFYKKQDYEPFAIPFVWPVLRDVNMKLEMKKLDTAIMRTIENVVLLITAGTEPSKGGVNPQTVGCLKEMFQNESVGRVVVADWTVKGEFIIPDLKKVLGPEKYEILNQDIKEGLQNALAMEGTYSGISAKMRIFLKSLYVARTHFLKDFLIPQMELIGERLGFKSVPVPKFKEIDFENAESMQRVALRLYELGGLTPQQLLQFFETGAYPEADEVDDSQVAYIEKRKEGYYNPIVGGVPMISSRSEEERIKISKEQMELDQKNTDRQFRLQKEQAKQQAENPQPAVPNNTPKAPTTTKKKSSSTPKSSETTKVPGQAGRPSGSKTSSASYEMSKVTETVHAFDEAYNIMEQAYMEKTGVDELSEEQKKSLYSNMTTVACHFTKEEWNEQAIAAVLHPETLLTMDVSPEVYEIMAQHEGLGDWGAMILRNSK